MSNTKHSCSVCRNIITEGNLRIRFDGAVAVAVCCKTCFDAMFTKCECCDFGDLGAYMKKTWDNKHTCVNCFKRHYYSCHDTGLAVKKTVAVKLGTSYYCPTAAERYMECFGCHCIIERATGENTGGVCARCLRSVVREYNTRAEGNIDFLVMKTNKASGNWVVPNSNNPIRYYGIELEVEHNKDNPKKAGLYHTAKAIGEELSGFALVKRDGSLKNGFEIVTAPATYEVHQVYWERFFKNYKEREELSSYYTDTCGMHVHVSKASLSPLQIGKMLVFVYANANKKFIQAVAQRGCNRYNDYTNPKKFTDAMGGDWIATERRYTAVNATNPHTIEIRLFKGTISKAMFFKNLEFVKALVDFCESGTASMKACEDYKEFCKFVEKYATTYPNLYRFLVENEFCKFKSSKPKVGERRNIKEKLKKRPNILEIASDNIIPYKPTVTKQVYGTHNSTRNRKQFFAELRRRNEVKFSVMRAGKNNKDKMALYLDPVMIVIRDGRINPDYFPTFANAISGLKGLGHRLSEFECDVLVRLVNDCPIGSRALRQQTLQSIDAMNPALAAF